MRKPVLVLGQCLAWSSSGCLSCLLAPVAAAGAWTHDAAAASTPGTWWHSIAPPTWTPVMTKRRCEADDEEGVIAKIFILRY